jgi:methyl-accepting chemotaxis protein
MANPDVKKTRKFRSLSVTLAVAFLVLSILILLIASSLQIYFNFQTQREIIASQQQFIAQDAANTVRSFVQEKFTVLEEAASIGNLVFADYTEQKVVLEKLLGLEPAFRQIILLDAQRQELAGVSRVSSLLSGQLKGQNNNGLFSQTAQGKTYISSVYIDEVTSEPLVVMAVPVTNVFGDFKGTLMAEVKLKFMWDIVDKLRIGRTGRAYVVDRQGNLIAFGDISRVLRGENLASLYEVAEFVNFREPTAEEEGSISKGIDGTRVVTSHVSLGMPDWAVIVESPVTEAYETVIHAVTLSVTAIVLSAALAIVVGIYLSRRITNPIKKLTNVIEEISIGNLDVEIDPKLKESRNEIGTLARAFDRTIVSLKLAMRQSGVKSKREARSISAEHLMKEGLIKKHGKKV